MNEDLHSSNLIWIDLEMTGLDASAHRIIEIATIVTDPELNIIAKGPNLAIHQSEDELAKMDKWNIEHHTNSGLVEKVRASTVDDLEAENQTIEFLKQHVAKGASPICGSSVCQDKSFLLRYMPALAHYFHYRLLDVSTLKILMHYWAPQLNSQLQKETQHTAMQDIIDSIDELKFYRQHFLKLD